MEKTVKLALKGILLYTTIISAMLYVCGIDSLYDEGYFIISTLIVVSLICTCYKTISEKEADLLLLSKFFDGEDRELD